MAFKQMRWEPHEVVTEQGWHLTLFRLLYHYDGDCEPISEVDTDKAPVLIWHGGTQDATHWVGSLPFQE